MSKNVAVFVDVANIFYAAKAAGVDIDYVTLLTASSAGRDLVRAYAYTGLDPDNENQRNFHDFLRRHGYKVVSKDIRKYGDGKVKANLDIELVVDMMKTARNLDIAIVVSGDGDFAPAIRAVQEMGVRVEVVSFRGNTSSDLIDVADIFTDITQIAKVEKGSSRSGRRVATDDEDLSMTEVPDKMTEGTGDGRRRGRGSRSRTGEAAPARTTTARAGASRSRAAAVREAVVAEGTVVALPGEKLSRAARPAPAERTAPDDHEPEASGEPELELAGELVALSPSSAGVEGVEGAEPGEADGQPGEDAQHRRRRRRGGRGRGRGRGRDSQLPAAEGTPESGEPADLEEPEPLPAPRRPAFSFGSVWDSQLGKTAAASPAGTGRGPVSDDEDLEEPAIPEYLLAERRDRDAGRGRPGRGGGASRRGGAYAAALDRERFGGGRGSTPSRFAEPIQRHRDAGSGREGGGRGSLSRGYERPESRGSGGEPWSEVPPEIEAMLRAQLASGRATRPAPSREARPPIRAADRPAGRSERLDTPAPASEGTAPSAQPAPSGRPAAAAKATSRPRRGAAASRATATQAVDGVPAAPVDATPGSTPTSRASRASGASAAGDASRKPAGPARRVTKAASAAVNADVASPEAAASGAANRTRRTKAAAEAPAEAASSEGSAAPKRRVTRRKTTASD